MASRRPGPGELLAGGSGLLLLLTLFLPWFGLNGRARVPGTGQVISVGRDSLNAWESFAVIDIVIAVAAVLAVAVLVVALVATPPPALVAAAAGAAGLAALLIVYRLIDVPDIPVVDAGDTAYETGRKLGAFFGLLCTGGIAYGAVMLGAATPAPAAEPAAPEPVIEPIPEPTRRAPRPARPAPATREVASRSPAPEPAAPRPVPARAGRVERRPDGPPGMPKPAARKAPPAAPAPAARPPSPLTFWTRPAVDAECQAAWRRYDRRLGTRYASYFEDHPDLVGDQRASARDLAAALPPGHAELSDVVPEDAWQRQHLSAKSSQTLGVGLLGVAARRDPSLAWLWDALAPIPPAAEPAPDIEFAHVVDPGLLGERPRQTSFDVLVDDPSVLIGIETKWREHGVGGCLCRGDGVGPLAGGRCSRRVERRAAYWEAAEAVLGLGEREPGAPCPIGAAYETVRHAAALRALAGADRPALLLLLYDADNPYFAESGDCPGWPKLLDQAVATARPEGFRFVAISWQELVPALPLDEQTRSWAAEKHGLEAVSARSGG